MSLRGRSFVILAALTSVLAAATGARAAVVERIVAVVGERAILLSDLRQRARPFLVRVAEQATDGSQRAAATTQVYGQMLTRMIEEELEERAAAQSSISVTAREVDEALGRIAAQNRVSVDKVMAEARASGLTERQYRQEIRRQLLEAKLLNLRVQGRLRVTESDLEAEYMKLVREERARLAFRPALVHVQAPPTLPAAEVKARRKRAETVVERARRGEDFGALAREFSDDAFSRETGGLLQELRPGQLAGPLAAIAVSLDVGEVSDPIRHGDGFVVLKVVERSPSRLPAFEEARDELGQRVYMDKMDAARRAWLDGLKRRFHVDIRL
jgi:peptidyl-prolyl cis-trans isomerase SurA